MRSQSYRARVIAAAMVVAGVVSLRCPNFSTVVRLLTTNESTIVNVLDHAKEFYGI